MRKAVFNVVIVGSFIAVLGAVYYLGAIAVQSVDTGMHLGNTPLPFIVP